MKLYTLGFIFNTTFERVVLITKNRPEWQKGRLNGVGGKIEENETPDACIVREVREETGYSTEANDWTHVAGLRSLDWHMDVLGIIHHGDEEAIQSLTDERVGWYEVAQLPEAVLSNVPWLVYMSKDILQNNKIENVSIIYRTSDS